MECPKVQEAILECLDNAGPAEGLREIDEHLAGCPACAAFAAQQKTVDARLGRMLAPPELSPGFRTALRQRVRREAMVRRGEWLPDKVHFASCGLATLLCALFLPSEASAVLISGGALTVITYIPLIAVRRFFEEIEDTSQLL